MFCHLPLCTLVRDVHGEGWSVTVLDIDTTNAPSCAVSNRRQVTNVQRIISKGNYNMSFALNYLQFRIDVRIALSHDGWMFISKVDAYTAVRSGRG